MLKISKFELSQTDSIRDKKFLLGFYCMPGGMGCHGLVFAIFDDNTAYCLNVSDETNIPLANHFLSVVPEIPAPFGDGKRLRKGIETEIMDLGVGNQATFALEIYSDFLDFINKCKEESFNYGCFNKYLKYKFDSGIIDIFEVSRK